MVAPVLSKAPALRKGVLPERLGFGHLLIQSSMQVAARTHRLCVFFALTP